MQLNYKIKHFIKLNNYLKLRKKNSDNLNNFMLIYKEFAKIKNNLYHILMIITQ